MSPKGSQLQSSNDFIWRWQILHEMQSGGSLRDEKLIKLGEDVIGEGKITTSQGRTGMPPDINKCGKN